MGHSNGSRAASPTLLRESIAIAQERQIDAPAYGTLWVALFLDDPWWMSALRARHDREAMALVE